MHDEHIVATTGCGLNAKVRGAVQQGGNLWVNAVDGVYLTGLQCRGTGCGVVQNQLFDFVGPAAVFGIPVIVAAFERVAHAGLVDLDCVGARADAGCRIIR